jgi:hypothetical protein
MVPRTSYISLLLSDNQGTRLSRDLTNLSWRKSLSHPELILAVVHGSANHLSNLIYKPFLPASNKLSAHNS